MSNNETFFIIGAGISGLVLSLLMSRSGYRVALYDKRMIFDQEVGGRSINLTISGRGLKVLERLGLKEQVLMHSALLTGRSMHLPQSKIIRYKYGTKKTHTLHSIRRSKLIEILFNQIKLEAKVDVFLGCELIDIDKNNLNCTFANTKQTETFSKQADCVIGADGVFSSVRNLLLKTHVASYQQKVFDWGYKEFYFDVQEAAQLRLNTDHIHMWPKSNSVLIAIPNMDKTFSVIFTAPLKDKDGNLNDFNELVKRQYSDVISHSPSFLSQSGNRYHNYLVRIKVDKWHLDDKMVLLGDACHATYPFYGQGMNSALEDAVRLHSYICDPKLTRTEAFAAYEKVRKIDTNALHELSESHLYRMTQSMISSFWQAKDILDYYLARFFAGKWVYEYELIAHSSLAYSEILRVVNNQNKRKRVNGFLFIAAVLGMVINAKKMLQSLSNSLSQRVSRTNNTVC